jgi:thymidylate synthase
MNQIDQDYKNFIVEIIREFDYECAPRQLKIYEKLNHSFQIDMNLPIISIRERNLNYSFMFGEAAWILDGRNDLLTISKYMKNIKRFSDDGVTFFGAYGPKIITQISYIIDTLKKDKDSRQAVLTIWRENPRSSKDIPCTVAMQFFLRLRGDELYLHCITTMRSNDVWLGLPYDSFNFSAISFVIACHLNNLGIQCKLGKLYINAGSRHLYDTNLKDANIVRAGIQNYECDFSFNDLLEKYKLNPMRIVETLYQAADIKIGKEDGLTLSDKLQIIKNG